MTRSTEFSQTLDDFLEIRYLLDSSPPTELVLEKCRIDKDAADALTRVSRNCTTLKTIKIVDCKTDSSDISPILSAISKCTSIRHFTFLDDGLNLDCHEFDSVIRVIQLSRTLRTLRLNDIFCSVPEIFPALEALKSSTSIQDFEIDESEQFPTWPEPSETEKATLTTLLLELMSNNIVLTDLLISLAIHGSYLNQSKDVLLKAFHRSINLRTMSLVDRNDRSVHAQKSFSEIYYLNDLAAIVFKIGRILSGESLVCGKCLPTELVDAILRQVTLGSAWDDSLWKPIRRIAVDRWTIGRLMTNDEPFDAYELLYRCRYLL